MRVNIPEAAELLGISEDRIYDWIENRNFPAYKINDQYLINRSELLEWATAQKMPIAPSLFRAVAGEERLPHISSALASGGIFYNIRGTTRAEILRNLIARLPLNESEERNLLLEMFLARESLGATGIGDGIAIPHVRNPIILSSDEPFLSLCFIEPSSDFAAIDGKPVFALFVLICPTIHLHLKMLAQLSHLLRQQEFREKIQSMAPAPEILETAKRVERRK